MEATAQRSRLQAEMDASLSSLVAAGLAGASSTKVLSGDLDMVGHLLLTLWWDRPGWCRAGRTLPQTGLSGLRRRSQLVAWQVSPLMKCPKLQWRGLQLTGHAHYTSWCMACSTSLPFWVGLTLAGPLQQLHGLSAWPCLWGWGCFWYVEALRKQQCAR